jgi:hypothetical protein
VNIRRGGFWVSREQHFMSSILDVFPHNFSAAHTDSSSVPNDLDAPFSQIALSQ